MTDITHLEEQIAHLTRTVEDLSDVMAKQDSELRRLTSLVEHLAQRARARDTDGGAAGRSTPTALLSQISSTSMTLQGTVARP